MQSSRGGDSHDEDDTKEIRTRIEAKGCGAGVLISKQGQKEAYEEIRTVIHGCWECEVVEPLRNTV